MSAAVTKVEPPDSSPSPLRRIIAERSGEARATTRSRLLMFAPVLALALWAAVWVTVNTAEDIGRNDADGGAYIGKADEIRQGHGPTAPSTYKFDHFSPREAVALDGHVPSTHFPPGYPYVLAVVSFLTGDTLGAARVVAVACAFLNVLLIGLLAARLTEYRSVIATTAPVVLVLFVPDGHILDGPGWLPAHAGVYSEPLFTLLATGTLLLTAAAATRPLTSWRRTLLPAVALCAAALLTRYAGVALVLTLCLAVACFGASRPIAGRLLRGAAVGLAAILPMSLFQLWSAAPGGARSITHHPNPDKPLLERLGHFVFPFLWPPTTVWFGAIAVVLILTVAAFWSPPRARELWSDAYARTLYRISLMFIAASVATLWITANYLDVNTLYTSRLVAPIRGLVYAVVVAAVYRLVVPYLRTIVVSALLICLVALRVSVDWEHQADALDYAGRPATPTSATVERLRTLPPEALIITNNPSLLYFSAGRPSVIVPQRRHFLTREPNKEFAQELSEWGDILGERGGYAFFTHEWTNNATALDLDRYVDLRLISESKAESLYRISPRG